MMVSYKFRDACDDATLEVCKENGAIVLHSSFDDGFISTIHLTIADARLLREALYNLGWEESVVKTLQSNRDSA